MSEPPAPLPPSRDEDLRQLKGRYLAAVQEAVTPSGSCLGSLIFWAIMAALAATVALIPVALGLIYRRHRNNRRSRAAVEAALRFAHAARPVMAFPLMVNEILRSPGEEPAPGLVLITFDPRLENDVKELGALAVRVSSGGEEDTGSWTEQDKDFVDGLMYDEQYHPFRRRRLPATITGGAEVFVCDLMIQPLLLYGRHIHDEMPLVACMAEPGDRGRLVQMPWWIVAAQPAPGERERDEFLASVVSVYVLDQVKAIAKTP